MKVLILPSAVDTEVLQKKDFGIDVTIHPGEYNDMEVFFSNEEIKVLLKGEDIKNGNDYVWLNVDWRRKHVMSAIKLYLDNHNIANKEIDYESSKLTDQMHYCINGIQSPKTYFCPNVSLKENYKNIIEHCGLPTIVKDSKGSKGVNSYLAESEEDLLRIISELPENYEFFFQEFIPNDYDWGVLVLNGKVLSAEKSFRSEGEFRNNAARGAEEVFTDISKVPEAVKRMAIKAAEKIGLGWSRSDIVIDKRNQEPHILETNRYPGTTTDSPEMDAVFQLLKSELRRSKLI
jgi:hypothetical protein